MHGVGDDVAVDGTSHFPGSSGLRYVGCIHGSPGCGVASLVARAVGHSCGYHPGSAGSPVVQKVSSPGGGYTCYAHLPYGASPRRVGLCADLVRPSGLLHSVHVPDGGCGVRHACRGSFYHHNPVRVS